MKKLLAILLALILFISIVGCSSSTQQSPTTQHNQVQIPEAYNYFSSLNNKKYWYDGSIKLDLIYVVSTKLNLDMGNGIKAIRFFDLTQFDSTENVKSIGPSITMNLFDYNTNKTKTYKLAINESNEQNLKEFLTNIEKSQEEIKEEIYQQLLNSAKVLMEKGNFSEALNDIKLAESIETTEETAKLETQVESLKVKEEIKVLLNKAQEYEKENSLVLAKSIYNEIIREYPDSEEAKVAKAGVAAIDKEIKNLLLGKWQNISSDDELITLEFLEDGIFFSVWRDGLSGYEYYKVLSQNRLQLGSDATPIFYYFHISGNMLTLQSGLDFIELVRVK